MKRFFIFLIVLVGAVAAVGFYRGWFTVDWEHGDGKGQVTGTVDNDKIDADKKKAADEIRRLGEKGNSHSDTSAK
jgi:hypothetical protein